jgi:hypothetical protein
VRLILFVDVIRQVIGDHLYTYFRKGYASHISSAIEEVTGKKPITFAQFAKDYT